MTDPVSSSSSFVPSDLIELDPADPPAVVFYPVRHYSPTSSRVLWELADAIAPSAVLVEGPADFNARLDELMMPGHVLPIALYSYVRLADDTKRSAFYPYCEYAPEWQAQLLARERGVPFRFIDLPWSEMALLSERQHRYSDEHFQKNPYPEVICEKMNVADFDELWDVLFELDRGLDWREYLRRCHEFCWHLRIFGGEESEENVARETFMTEQIETARDDFGGPVLVVTGGYHSGGLWARLNGEELDYIELSSETEIPESVDDGEPAGRDEAPGGVDVSVEVVGAPAEREEPEMVEAGITITPFTYERIDKLSGYASGVHGPAFYQCVWEARRDGRVLDSRAFLYEIVEDLREKGQIASTADIIGVESTARALATLRGRREVWRFDLLDAISSTLIKEAQDAEYAHPILQVARSVLRGDRRGAVDPDAPLPPLVKSARKTLARHALLPESGDERRIDLDLEAAEDRARSRILHRCRALGLAGFDFAGGTDFARRDDLSDVFEEWLIRWSPEFEATLIESAIYGVDLGDAAASRVLERARAIKADAEAAALLAIDAVLMGLDQVAETLYDRLKAIVRDDTDFFGLAGALEHLLYLYRYDEVLGTRGDARLADLLRETYARSLWLFEGLGTVKDRDAELIASIRTLFQVFQRCYRHDADDFAEFLDIFGRTAADEEQIPLTRGSATGAMYTLGELEDDRVLAMIRYFSDPVQLGDFLVGFFSLAREAAKRDPRLIELLDEVVCSLSEEEFLEVLPALRLAFTFFTPLEKHGLVDTLFTDQHARRLTAVDERSARAGAALERRIRDVVEAYGIRGVRAATMQAASLQSTSAGSKDVEITPEERRERWRLIFGASSEGSLGGLSGGAAKRDRLLAYLYDREYGPSRNVRGGSADRGRRGSLDPSQLTVPEWINGVHELFPRRTVERLERDALDRYEIEEIVTRPDVLSRATPNPTLLKAVLRTKHLMNSEVLNVARRMVRAVVDELMEKLAREIRQPFTGARDRRRRSFLKVAKNFDAVETIRRNLKYWDADRGHIVIRAPYFFSRIRQNVDRWKLIIAVDQSASMLDSVIHSAVTASVFFSLEQVRTHLVAFDTDVIDLTADARDPVETLMSVQLGGGTDIANALHYASTLVDNPRRTIVVLITDFMEGGPVEHLLAATKELVDGGVTLLGLAALDEQANPFYDRETAAKVVALGAHVGAMTPGELAEFVAERVR